VLSPLHETTRRTVCRVAFLALCVAPTVAVLAWAANARSPERVSELERELAAALELTVSVDEVKYPRPDVAAYSGVALVDSETRRVVAELEHVEVTRHAEGIVLVVPRAELDVAQLDRLWRAVDRQLRVRRATQQPPLRLAIERLTLHGAGANAITLENVGGQLNAADESSRAGLRFSLPPAQPNNAAGEPLQFVVERSHGKDPSITRLELRTGGAPLPLAMLEALLPSLGHLGNRAEFVGQLWASRTGDAHTADSSAWTGELTGRLAQVDLESLVTRQFPHKLSGDAEITLQKLSFVGGRMTRLAGRIEAGPGVIGQSLLSAAADALAMRIAGQNSNTDLLKYDRLAATFELDADHITIRGATSATPKEARPLPNEALCILRDAYGPLLFEADNNRQPQPALGFVRMLVPHSETFVPATQESEWLLRSLPQPSVVPPEHSSASPKANLREATTDKN
jgi:hypothetical protein